MNLDMIGQCAQLTEMLGTVVAVVRFFAGMNFQMIRQCRRLTERLITHIAFVGLLARMDLHVVGQCAQLAKSSIAHRAMERLFWFPAATAAARSVALARVLIV